MNIITDSSLLYHHGDNGACGDDEGAEGVLACVAEVLVGGGDVEFALLGRAASE